MVTKSELISYKTITSREIKRFCRIWPQTIFPPVIMVSLYFLIFGNLIGFKRIEMFGVAIKIKWLVNGILLAFLLPHRERFKQMGFFFILIVFPLLVLLMLDTYYGYWFIQRQFTWVMPFYAFFLAWCWDASIVYVTDRVVRLKERKWGKT